MSTSGSSVQVRAWTAVGAMSPEAVFSRFDETVSRVFSAEEATALRRNFTAICGNERYISKSAFTTFVVSKRGLPNALKYAVNILFDSLCYMSKVPLQARSPPPNRLTLEELTRAIAWLLPSRILSVITSNDGTRKRGLVDHRRLLFQSLATSSDKEDATTDVELDQSSAPHSATDRYLEHGKQTKEGKIELDEDGNEMYHDIIDIVDVLESTQPYVPAGWAEQSRDAFRTLAAEFNEGAPSLNDQIIPSRILESFLLLPLSANFVDEALDVDQDLKAVAHSIAAQFRQDLSIEGTTWPMFDYTASRLLVRFNPIHQDRD